MTSDFIPADLLQGRLAIVDLETTGGNPLVDRVIEFALIEYEGGEETGRWEGLVNPGVEVPPLIEGLTGICTDMLAAAPSFPALASQLHERLADRLFIAHNVRFDYGFIENEFARAGLDYAAQTLCTVRLSRRLYPDHRRHSLDALIERHAIRCGNRHRAMADAETLVQFLQIARAECDAQTFLEALHHVTKPDRSKAVLRRHAAPTDAR